MKTSQRNYQVGYKKPPVQTRFKKGQSGNSKGRAKAVSRVDSLESHLIRALNSSVVITEGQQSRRVTKYETAVMQIVNNAASGRIQFAKLLLQLLHLVSSERAPITGQAPENTTARERIMAKLDKIAERIRAQQGKAETQVETV